MGLWIISGDMNGDIVASSSENGESPSWLVYFHGKIPTEKIWMIRMEDHMVQKWFIYGYNELVNGCEWIMKIRMMMMIWGKSLISGNLSDGFFL